MLLSKRLGSSPRMRGTLCHNHGGSGCQGIIPADAGNTKRLSVRLCLTEDHPRGCGEHTFITSARYMSRGSSPRMRGTPPIIIGYGSHGGIIPADAGNTSNSRAKLWPKRDHPRGCGEHGMQSLAHSQDAGSSPRMRGTQKLPTLTGTIIRIIPADAGNTMGTAAKT